MWGLSLVIAVLLAGGLAAPALSTEHATPVVDRTPGPLGTPAPLAETTLQALGIRAFGPGYEPTEPTLLWPGSAIIGLQPGDAVVLVLGIVDFEGCGPIGFACFTPVPANARWSVSPRQGAAIATASGLLEIASTTPSGSDFRARADIEGGRRLVETEVHVYTPTGNPFVGSWREEAQLACGTEAAVEPALPIDELAFAADGSFRVTWTPFESYVDYWGTYEFDLAQGTIELAITGGNTIPLDVDGQGRFALDEAGRLILSDIWLGNPPSERYAATPDPGSTAPHCGHRFT